MIKEYTYALLSKIKLYHHSHILFEYNLQSCLSACNSLVITLLFQNMSFFTDVNLEDFCRNEHFFSPEVLSSYIYLVQT